MQYDTVLTPRTTISPFHVTQTQTQTPTRIAFPTRPTFKAHSTLNSESAQYETISQMSFYDLLGIPETGSLPEIKQAYKHLARMYHPDVSPPDRVKEYTERFIRVQEAYETLSDPRRRAVYDRDLSRGLCLAFSGRKCIHPFDEEMEDKSDWKTRWQSQLSGLKNRSMNKDEGNMSWGARMRQQRNESSEL